MLWKVWALSKLAARRTANRKPSSVSPLLSCGLSSLTSVRACSSSACQSLPLFLVLSPLSFTLTSDFPASLGSAPYSFLSHYRKPFITVKTCLYFPCSYIRGTRVSKSVDCVVTFPCSTNVFWWSTPGAIILQTLHTARMVSLQILGYSVFRAS